MDLFIKIDVDDMLVEKLITYQSIYQSIKYEYAYLLKTLFGTFWENVEWRF